MREDRIRLNMVTIQSSLEYTLTPEQLGIVLNILVNGRIADNGTAS
jgi:hypothetical protein